MSAGLRCGKKTAGDGRHLLAGDILPPQGEEGHPVIGGQGYQGKNGNPDSGPDRRDDKLDPGDFRHHPGLNPRRPALSLSFALR